jgi:pantoate--beta-alanine ligase
MVKAEKITKMREIIKEWKSKGLTIGFVPTMGCLHEGHMSLVERAARENNRVVVSIFVNPIQFGPNEDYEKYPRSLSSDLEKCCSAGVHAVFCPSVNEMYPDKSLAFVNVESLDENLCGKTRPNHFRGVCTVVAKLFNIISPDRAYFGQKDAQQLAIVSKMTSDLNFDIEIISCPILREKDGLALSSRNSYLSSDERAAAVVIYSALESAKALLKRGERSAGNVKAAMKTEIEKQPLAAVDYVEVVDAKTLSPVEKITGTVLVAAAVYIGKTRLIDNFIFCLDEGGKQ